MLNLQGPHKKGPKTASSSWPVLSWPGRFPISSCLLCDWPTRVTEKLREGRGLTESRTPNFPHFAPTTSLLPSGQLSHLSKSQHPLCMPGERTRVTPPRQSQPLQGLFLGAKVFQVAILCGKGFGEGHMGSSEELGPRRAGTEERAASRGCS